MISWLVDLSDTDSVKAGNLVQCIQLGKITRGPYLLFVKNHTAERISISTFTLLSDASTIAGTASSPCKYVLNNP